MTPSKFPWCYNNVDTYTHNLSVAVLSGLLRVPFVVISNPIRIQKLILFLISGSRLFSFHCPCFEGILYPPLLALIIA